MERRLKVGVIGLGRVAIGITRALSRSPQFELVAAADLRPPARQAFQDLYHGRAYESAEELCADPEIEAVWILTPHERHCEHAVMAAEHGKHIVVEKPMAITVEQCQRMVEAAERNRIKLLCGGSRSYDPALRAMRQVITSGVLGKVCALNTWSYSGWMIRPREGSELDVARGGSVLFSQGAHQADLLRVMGGGKVRSVRAAVGQWLPERPCPGYYAAFLEFEDGAPGTMIYDGYGYFLAHELVPWGESRSSGASGGEDRSPEAIRQYRKLLKDRAVDEGAVREATRFGGASSPAGPREETEPEREREENPWVPTDAGLLIVSCERGAIRQSPRGIYVYDDEGRREIAVPRHGDSRSTEFQEFYRAVVEDKPVLFDGRWGAATLEVCLAILQSSMEGREIYLENQVSAPL